MLDLLHNAKLAKQMNERKNWRKAREEKLKSCPKCVTIYGVRYLREDMVIKSERMGSCPELKVEEVIR